jgi:hypothetical protein
MSMQYADVDDRDEQDDERPEMGIYLGGPIRSIADPYSWRENVKNGALDNPDIDFVFNDPLDKFDCRAEGVEIVELHEYDDEAQADPNVTTNTHLVSEDIGLISESDMMFVGSWTDRHTVGTPMEICIANYVMPMPVIVQGDIPEDDISPWLKYHTTGYHNSFNEALNHTIDTATQYHTYSQEAMDILGNIDDDEYPEWDEDVGHEFASAGGEPSGDW